MRGDHGVLFVAVAVSLSGCASGRTRQELARLQSQVGVLDERVTQLERSATSGTPAAPASETVSTGEEAVSSVATSEKSATAAKPAARKAPLKFSTRDIQQALKNAGFYQGAVDGKMGSMTREAVKEFQHVHGLTDDGVVGKQTWAKLSAYLNLSAESGEANASEVLK